MKKILHNQFTGAKLFSGKKLLLVAALIVTISASSFAAPKINSKAMQSFSKEYANASHVTWTAAETYTKASFVWNNQPMWAYYDEAGEYIGVGRTIDLKTIPLDAMKTIKERYGKYTATEAVEFDDAADTVNYYVSMENNKQKVILKISSDGNVGIFKRVRK